MTTVRGRAVCAQRCAALEQQDAPEASCRLQQIAGELILILLLHHRQIDTRGAPRLRFEQAEHHLRPERQSNGLRVVHWPR